MSKNKSKNNSNNETNLVKSTTNDQIENNNDKVKEDINPEFISVDISCDSCQHNPKNTTKKEQFLNLIGVSPNEEFYIDGEQKNSSYLIYHFTNDLHLLARSSNDKEGIMGWFTATSLGKMLDEDVKLIKIKSK